MRRRRDGSRATLRCRLHHRLVHEGSFRLLMPLGGDPLFFDGRGLPVPDSPPRVRLGGDGADPVERLVRENRMSGVEPTYATGRARYRREEDVPLELLERAMDAVA